MPLDSVLASMRGEQPPQMVAAQDIFLQNQPGAANKDTTNQSSARLQQPAEPQPPRSILNGWVHSGVGLLGFSESSTRNEIENYITEGLTAVPLFMAGGRGIALSAVMSGLNEAKEGERGWGLAADLTLGAAKGAGTKMAFDYLGAKKDCNFAAKGVAMGASARGINVGLSRQTWFDGTGQFQPATGLGTTAVSMFHPYALATDIASFGIAHGTIKGLSGMSERFATKLETSPMLQNSITAGAFGFTTGSLAEVQRQMTDPNAHFDPLQIALRGGASAATMTLAGAGGAYMSAPGQFVVKPQTEPFDPIGGVRTRYNQFRSWLGIDGGGVSSPLESTRPATNGVDTPQVQTSTNLLVDAALRTHTTITSPSGSEPIGIETTSSSRGEPISIDTLNLPVGDPVRTQTSNLPIDSEPVRMQNANPTVEESVRTQITHVSTDKAPEVTNTGSFSDTRGRTEPANATIARYHVEANGTDPYRVVRLQEPQTDGKPVVTNPGETNFVRFNETNYDLWEPGNGFHFFRDGKTGHRAITSIDHHVRFELMDDGVWKARPTKSSQELRDMTPEQRTLFDQAMSMERAGLAVEKAHAESVQKPAGDPTVARPDPARETKIDDTARIAAEVNGNNVEFTRTDTDSYHVWNDSGVHILKDGNTKTVADKQQDLRFEQKDGGEWRVRRRSSNGTWSEVTPEQRPILERALAMEQLALAREPLTEANRADESELWTPRVVKGLEAVKQAISELPPDTADPMKEFLREKRGTREYKERVKMLAEVLSLPPEVRASDDCSGLDKVFRSGLAQVDAEIVQAGLDTAHHYMERVARLEKSAQRREKQALIQEMIAQDFLSKNRNQPQGNTIEEFLNNDQLASTIEEKLPLYAQRIDLELASRIVRENSGKGQDLEILNGNKPLAMLNCGGESLVLLMEKPIGNSGHRVLKLTFTEWQPEYGRRKFSDGQVFDARLQRLTPEALGDSSRGRVMFYTQELLREPNAQELHAFEQKVANSGYWWADTQVKPEMQIGVDSNDRAWLFDYGAISIEKDNHY